MKNISVLAMPTIMSILLLFPGCTAEGLKRNEKESLKNSVIRTPDFSQKKAHERKSRDAFKRSYATDIRGRTKRPAPYKVRRSDPRPRPPFNTETYDRITDNSFLAVKNNPLSTFSVDVDTASYSIMRRFLNQGKLPPKGAVRIEELINYFRYDYPKRTKGAPFSVSTELSTAPWNAKHRLLHVGILGRTVDIKNIPPRNLTFLLDVSGSMGSPNKLPLLKRSLKLLVNQLGEKDTVSIVVYAGASGLVLPPTSGERRGRILSALNRLRSGGSTNGGAGIELAYKTAEKNFRRDGINRVILATDGDFNIGTTNQSELVRLIEKKRETGIFLTVLGFGMGNYKDSIMEKLADKGNGNYAYIDNFSEARKVLGKEAGSTLITIAKDVKLQLEFNPSYVKAYRLIGYENRMLRAEDFNNDKKDAGEIGAGHTVTALYEIVPVDGNIDLPATDPLRYQKRLHKNQKAYRGEIAMVKIRYKKPDGKRSKLISLPVLNRTLTTDQTSANFRFSAGVAAFGMLLRDSPYRAKANFKMARKLAEAGRGKDSQGYRAELIRLMQIASELKGDSSSSRRSITF